MATLSDLKTRIADELTRDDMGSGGEAEGALNRAIDSAIDQSENELFWFNHSNTTANTVGGVSTIAVPTGMRVVSQVSYLEEPLIRDRLDRLQPLTETGIPSRWAQDGDTIYLWPQPDAAYSLSIQGTADVGTPASDGDSNIWTTEAYDLIAARVKARLLRFPFRDPDGLALARDEEAEALFALRQETRKRRQTPLRSRDFEGRRYNINSDR